jgi:hypothetical protein
MLVLPSILRWRRNAPRWRSLCELTSPAEAELVTSRCRFSLSTVEVLCNPAATYCALVEQELPRTWLWSVYGVEDIPRAAGAAPTRAAAQRAAVKALVDLDRRGVIELRPVQPGAASASTHAPA